MAKTQAFTQHEDKWRDPVKAWLLEHPEYVGEGQQNQGYFRFLESLGFLDRESADRCVAALNTARFPAAGVYLRLRRELRQRGIVFTGQRRLV